MIYNDIQHIILLCEGQSEYLYIEELNRFLRESGDNNLLFIPKTLNGGDFTNVIKKYKELRCNNRNIKDICIVIDFDLYSKSSSRQRILYEKNKSRLPKFLFNYMNFEDFLAMHLSDDIVSAFSDVCKAKKHNLIPLMEGEYSPLFSTNVFPDYQKGNFPFDRITSELLNNLFKHNKDSSIIFKSDFADFLEQKIVINQFI